LSGALEFIEWICRLYVNSFWVRGMQSWFIGAAEMQNVNWV